MPPIHSDTKQKLRDAQNHKQLDRDIQDLIRNRFDIAVNRLDRQSWINVARDTDYEELAEELESLIDKQDINLN